MEVITIEKVLVIDSWELVPWINSAGALDPDKKSPGLCILEGTILAHLPKGKKFSKAKGCTPRTCFPFLLVDLVQGTQNPAIY